MPTVAELKKMIEGKKDGDDLSPTAFENLKDVQSHYDQQRTKAAEKVKQEIEDLKQKASGHSDYEELKKKLDAIEAEKLTDKEKKEKELADLGTKIEATNLQLKQKEIGIRRRDALDKAELSNEWVSSIAGDTVEEIESSVKVLKDRLEKLGATKKAAGAGNPAGGDPATKDEEEKKIQEFLKNEVTDLMRKLAKHRNMEIENYVRQVKFKQKPKKDD